MPVLQLILLRSCMLVACTLPAARHPQARQLLAERPKLWLVRGVLGFASVAFIQQAVHLLAISDAVALALLSPIVVAVLGTLVLRERPPQLLLVALPLALSGALLLVKPGLLGALAGGGGFVGSSNGSGGGIETTTSLGPASLGVAAGLGHVLSSAGAKLSVRRLAAGSTSPHAAAMIVLSAGLVSAVGSAAICVLQQTQLVWPQHVGGWVLVAGVGVMVSLAASCCCCCCLAPCMLCMLPRLRERLQDPCFRFQSSQPTSWSGSLCGLAFDRCGVACLIPSELLPRPLLAEHRPSSVHDGSHAARPSYSRRPPDLPVSRVGPAR
jgi:drug/metabolite transporter (DMT)-like permease